MFAFVFKVDVPWTGLITGELESRASFPESAMFPVHLNHNVLMHKMRLIITISHILCNNAVGIIETANRKYLKHLARN